MRFALAAFVLLGTPAAHAATITPAIPDDRPAPQFRAASGSTTGTVVVQFAIGVDGHVHDAKVLESNPPGLFEAVAVQAVSRWLYHPRLEDGRAVEQPNNRIRFNIKPPPDAAVPLYRSEDFYPRDAYAARREGAVTVGFDITPGGATTNVHVLNSTPSNVFDQAAVSSVRDWEYAPLESGQPIINQTVQIAYTLANALLAPVPDHPLKLVFPEQARNAFAQGDCIAQFWIEPDGTTSNASISFCAPSGYFEQTILDAIKHATYKMEADPVVNRRRIHVLHIRFRFDGEPGSVSYLKPGQWIKLRYTLTPTGHARHIEVVAQSDPSIPHDNAIEQMQHTVLRPVIENGQPVEKPDQIIVISGDTP